TDDHENMIHGEWYLTERYTLGDGGGIEYERFDIDDTERLNIITLSDGVFTGTFSGEDISGTFRDNIISFSITDDGTSLGFTGGLEDGILCISSIWTDDEGSIGATDMIFSRDGAQTAPPTDIPENIVLDIPMAYSDEDTPVLRITDSGGRIITAEDDCRSEYILIMDMDGLGGYGMVSSGGTPSQVTFTISDETIVIGPSSPEERAH
ncbi:MAG: hypothetical protein ACI38Y_07130, partial [Candidatus Methanomethylophilaceae archaeon]